MIKKQTLIVLVVLCASFVGFGQIAQFDFPATNSLQVSIKDANVSVSDMTLSTGTIALNITTGTYFTTEPYIEGTGGWAVSTQASAKNFYFTVTVSPGYEFSISNISFNAYSTSAGPSAFGFAIGSTDIFSVNAPSTSLVSVNQPVIGQNNLTSVTIKIQGWDNGSRATSGNGVFKLDDVIVSGTVTPVPTIIATPTALTNFTYAEGDGPSAEQSFSVEGYNLTDDIDVTPPTNWEISTTSGGPYQTTPITLTQAGGNVATTTIYTRMVSGLLNTNSPFTGNIAVTSALDGLAENVAVDGTVVPPLADVVITEIMYNTTGTDDEWIEICNVSGSTQDISNYIIDVGTSTVFIFPGGTTIANGDCKIVSLGSNGDTIYNNGGGTPATGYCTFTPDFGISASTNDTDNLVNSTNTITLLASNGTTQADGVAYNSSDGGNGNGSSLHVIEASLDNSNTSSNWQEVGYGGSPGINSLFPNCLPAGVEINVEGNLGNYPDIPDGFSNPVGTNNTLFPAQYIGASQTKSYRIQSLLADDVIISSVTLTGDTGDFTITGNPTSPVVYGTPSILEITFSPTVTGTRNAVVHIFNNDTDEPEYTFAIQGNGLCLEGSNTITPSSGPVGTIVTVTGTNLSTATASFNGLSATVNHISATEMEVIVPNGAVTGNLKIVDSQPQPCTTTIPFTVIDNKISSCEGGLPLTEIFISEVTDATYGGLTYIELYNPTSSDIDLSSYSIDIYINGNTDPLNSSLYKTQPLSGTIFANQTFVISAGYSGSSNCDSQPGGNASYSNFNSTTLGGINKKDNEHDYIGLLHSGVLIDEFGVFGDKVWMDTLHTTVSGDRGFDFRRLNTASPFTSPFDDNDWLIIDWAGSSSGSCSTNDYNDIRIYDFSSGTPPLIPSGPTIDSYCNTATISVAGSEGFSGGNSLAYQWYTSAPGDPGWTLLIDGAIYDNVASATLDILDISLLEGYQYYCQIREDDANCYTASNAVQLTLPTTIWNGSSWSNGTPTIGTIATLNGHYNTSTNGNFSACSLVINDSFTLNIADGDYVEVENNLTVNGNIVVQTKGTFVQNNDLGVVDGAVLSDKTKIVVNKNTASPAYNWYEYTYWSSPVKDEIIGDGLFESSTNRRFLFNAQNYLDHCAETNNNNICDGNGGAGLQDGIDDDNNDWQWVNGATVMQPGVGYASTHDATIFGSTPGCPGPTCSIEYTFEGPFNNGEIKVPVYRNDSEMNDTNSNFIGNPYPSAIDVDEFFDLNAYTINPAGALEGVIYLWSQDTAPSSTTNGNQVLNFSQSDYAIINAGVGETAGGDNNGDGIVNSDDKPNRFIPSGQGFFVSVSNMSTVVDAPSNPDPNIKTVDVIFNNSMRMADGTSNSQFFRTSGSTISKKAANKVWINLTSDNGIFSQILVGYVDGATHNFDGAYYDTTRNTGKYSIIYSIIQDSDNKFAIQGKAIEDINTDEVIKLGFDTNINVATLYKLSIAQVEGEFLTSNTMYLKDNFLNKVHNLTASDYSFTSEVGEFKDRFEIMFRSETLSDTDALLNSNKLTIIELNDGRVQMKTNSPLNIKSVQILDILGRTLYQLKGSSATEIYTLSNLSQSTYIAKVELSNGQIITKRAIKRN